VQRRWLIGTACTGALVVSVAALAAGSQTFVDPTGDAGAAPDITTVAVSNDDNGVLTFAVTLANPALLMGENVIAIALNTDKNLSTGSPGDGSEYAIVFGPAGHLLVRWNGTMFAPVQTTTLTRVGATTVAINRSELGATSLFDFYLIAGTATAQDEAPNGTAFWTYQLQLKPVLDSISARFQPGAPRAGQLFTVTRVTLRLEGGQDVTPSAIRCRARLGTSTLAPAGNCRWRIPKKKSKGKRLSVTITASYQGESASFLPFTFTVR
jgi:hypothetical protein